MKNVFLIVSVFLCMQIHAQENLVPNGSFEENTDCPSAPVPWTLTYWENGNGLTPDYYHVCGSSLPVQIPSNLRGYQYPYSGQAYVGVWAFGRLHPDAREYIQVELDEPLTTSVRYLVKFYVSLAENYGGYAVSTLGAAITAEPPEVIGENGLLDAEPQVLNDPLYPITDTTNWVLITDTVVSRGDSERYLTIGNFFSDGDSDTTLFNPNATLSELSYYYIDDVSVIALDSVPSGIEIPEHEENSFNIYPNPSNGKLTLTYQLGKGQLGEVAVFDLMGRRVFSEPLTGSSLWNLTLDDVSSGIYTVRVMVDNKLKINERVSILKE